MTLTRLACAALAATALALTGGDARAAYTYSTSITIGAPIGAPGVVVNTPGTGAVFTTTNGTVVNFADINSPGLFLVPGVNTFNFGNLTVTTTSATPETFIVPYTDIVTITNPALSVNTGTFTITGRLLMTNVSSSGGVSNGQVHNLYDAPFSQNLANVGGGFFGLDLGTGAPDQFFGPPTINNPAAGGDLGGEITAAIVPEPSAVVLSLIGLPALMLISRRRAAVA
jgi:hypothetical protein